MTDRDRHRLRGPVHTMRTETTEWDAATASWKPPSGYQLFTFRTDGDASHTESRYGEGTSHTAYVYDAGARLTAIESRSNSSPKTRMEFRYDDSGRPVETTLIGPDGTRQQAETFTYDRNGRKTRVQYRGFGGLPDDVDHESQGWQRFVPHGSEPMPSPITTVVYDAGNRPTEVLIHNASHELQYRVTLTRDQQGRLLTADTTFAGISALLPGVEKEIENASVEDRAKMEAMLEATFERQTFLSVRFSYDSAGRLAEETFRMGTLMEEVKTYRYDKSGALVEEASVTRSQTIDGDGPEVRAKAGEEQGHRTGYDYQFDTHGNWTERVTTSQCRDAGDSRWSAVERRAFTYYP
jgi:hypothetical protein